MGLENVDKSKWTQVQCLNYIRELEAKEQAKKKIFAEAEKINMERRLTDDELYIKAIDNYGSMPQIGQAVEELLELAIELNRLRNSHRYDVIRIAEETADVEIMLSQVKKIISNMGCKTDAMIDRWKTYKNARLERRLEEKKTYNYID
jgi:predicted regulator of amino acid metabolism with ACT domain